ncbi:PARP7S [Mytilus edulis]|uniref:PARP7S n=1 Tax=Mytilus edulis TaxID=6550 RepID=A0A8S3UTQ8_MYTED|nr:PARP7S [Mytilus edulis]
MEKKDAHTYIYVSKKYLKLRRPMQVHENHSITQFHNKWVLGAWNMSRLPETEVFKYISVPPRQRKEFDDKSDDSELSQSVQSDNNVSASSESLSSTASCDPKIKKLITSGENRSKEDVNASEDSICGIEKQGATSGKVVKPKSPPKPSKLTPSDPDYQERNPDLLKDETENSKICIFVSKNKCPSALCKTLHLPSGIPYLWQIKIDKWFSLTLAENEKIEKGYCYLLDDESTEACEVKYNGSKYSCHIWFSKMQAKIYDVDGQPVVGDNQHDQWCNVRRLSTPSFTEKKMMVDSYLTQWRWYWKDYSKNGTCTISEKILKNIDVPPRRVPNYPNAKGDLDHYKHRVDDDDDLYKGSDFMVMDE